MRYARNGFAPLTLPAVFFAIWMTVSVSAHAQYTLGEPVFGDSGTAQANSGSYLDATLFVPAKISGGVCNNATPNGDMCGYIQMAICALPTDTSGNPQGVVDARGFTTTFASSPACAENPFSNPTDNQTLFSSGNITVLLPANIITVNTVIAVPKQSVLRGEGSNTTFLKLGSTLGSLMSSTTNNCDDSGSTRCYPVICMGGPIFSVTGTPGSCETPNGGGSLVNNPRVQIESLGIDMQSTTYGVGIANITAEEKSWVRDVQIIGLASGGRGINIARTGEQSLNGRLSQPA